MNHEIYTYALVKSLYDQNRDFLETFAPFLLSTLDLREPFDLRHLQGLLGQRYSLSMPLHVMSLLLRRVETQGLVKRIRSDRGNDQYLLTLAGQDRAAELETERDVTRRVNALLEDMVAFCKDRGLEADTSTVYDVLKKLVQQNFSYVLEYVDPLHNQGELHLETDQAVEELVVKYLAEAEKSKPNEYKTIRDLVHGSMISAVLCSRSPEVIDEIHESFVHTVMYLDSNFAFSLLGLHSPHRGAAAGELYRLLSEFKVSVRMFSFTVDEMRRVLTRYAAEYDKGSLPTDVDSVYVQLRLNGFAPSDAITLRQNLEDELLKHGVGTEQIELDVKKYVPEDPVLLDMLVYKKGDLSTLSSQSDLAAIDVVARLRKKPAHKVEEAAFFFLSSDGVLYRFNNDKMDHRANGSIPEVMLDRVLTNILWLKNPGLEISLEAIVAAHSRGFVYKEAVWFRVCEVLARLKNEQKIDATDVTYLLSSTAIDEILESTESLEQITPEMIMAARDHAHQERAQETERLKAEKEAEATAKIEAAEEAAGRAVADAEERARLASETAKTEVEDSKQASEGEKDDIYDSLVEGARGEADAVGKRFALYAYLFLALCGLATAFVLWLAKALSLLTGVATLVGTGVLALIAMLCESVIADWAYKRRMEELQRVFKKAA